MKDELKQDMQKDPAELEREADRARANVEHTIEALERRFSPGQMLDQVLQVVKQNGGDFGRNLSTQVRNNPVPVVLTGIGLTWLMAASDRPPRSYGSYAGSAEYGSADYGAASTYGSSGSTGSSMGSRVSSAANAAKGAASHAADTTRSAAESARSAMSHAAESARGAMSSARYGTRSAMGHMTDTAQRMGYATRSGGESVMQGFEYLRREQPLVLGALAIATGALIGAMFPRTSAEDEWMGEASDETARRVKEEARRKADQAKSMAADVAESARSAAEPRRTESTSGSESAATTSGTGTAGSGATGIGTPPPGSSSRTTGTGSGTGGTSATD